MVDLDGDRITHTSVASSNIAPGEWQRPCLGGRHARKSKRRREEAAGTHPHLHDAQSSLDRSGPASGPRARSNAPDAPLADVAAEMADHKYGCAVVMNGPHLAGIFTTVDALRALMALAGGAS